METWDSKPAMMEVMATSTKIRRQQAAAATGDCGSKVATIITNDGMTSFSFTASDDEFDEIVIPPPTPNNLHSRSFNMTASDHTPLVGSRRTRRNYDSDNDSLFSVSSNNNSKQHRCPPGISGFFFGFMYEDYAPDANGVLHSEEEEEISTFLKLLLCFSFMLTTAASTVPVTLVPVMAHSRTFTSQAAASSVIGSAIGKFINGPLGDVFGARRVSMAYATLLSVSLIILSLCRNESSSLWACFFVDFFQSVQWPAILVILASHARGRSLVSGIYAVSLSARVGSLLAIPLTSLLLRSYHWRTVAVLASCGALCGAFLLMMVTDSPFQVNDPQNPIAPLVSQQFVSMIKEKPPLHRIVRITVKTITAVVSNNFVPAIKAILKSITFWIVAIAHAGDAIIYTSTRVLGMYYYDTAGGNLSENTASSLAVVLSLGTIFGLAIAGNLFTATSDPRRRKRLIGRLYLTSICACYLLAALAIPIVQQIIGETGLTLAFQLIGTFFMGFGGAVPSYIPGIVGASFGNNKGLFLAYSDGIAFGLSALVWRVVRGAVHGGEGWAYGWAAVALLVVVCALVMLEFFENYFVRKGPRKERAGYETIFFV